MSVGAGQLTFFVLKRIIGRERPCATEPHCWSILLPPDRFSFPSGHTITAFAIAFSLGLYYPALLVGLVFCALSVAASRVILGLHYLSDVARRHPDRHRDRDRRIRMGATVSMKTGHFCALALCALCAGEKKSPQGHGEDESVAITATVLSPEQLKDAVGSDFDNNYIVLDVRVTPKGGKPYLVHLDDFILRSEPSGEHSGPFLTAGQIAGAGALVVERTYGNKANADSPRPLEGTKVK